MPDGSDMLLFFTPKETLMLKKWLAGCSLLFASLTWAAVDVTKASEADLQQVKGIGPATATKILEERKSGNFKSWDDFITRVKGVGNANADAFSKNGLTVDGRTYKDAATSTPAQKKENTPPAQTNTKAVKN